MKENDHRSVSFLDIDEDNSGQRIDNWLKRELKGVPTSLIYRILRKGEVRVNKKRIKPEYKLQAGDVLRIPPIHLDQKKEAEFTVGDRLQKVIEESILFEDEVMLVINKPSGIAVHGGSGLQFGVIETLRQIRPNIKQLELVHRLDKETSGCLMIAKKRSALRNLHQQLREKVVDKRYWALVSGAWPSKLKRVELPLFKNENAANGRNVKVDQVNGKPSQTRFKVLRRFSEATLVEAFPVTGRTHQIRVHATESGHPIALDDRYGESEFDKKMKRMGVNRLFLHAATLTFIHPRSEEKVRIEAPLEQSLKDALDNLATESN
ncbi:23S rRNA pseudouridine(955/2504/2580) synthase RluC [Catenovulum sp. 2E275]|uniref:23S rRNA pseudouridine(955/2504/2580) synthase RluC n=1 Tax=Catenovulum sp. 2E275 TaxID=2980497 RepID=UPI0021D22B50|nr:23S rRNA pseudouridine(955/2504/2580) synthase RluC [Catenovulum sp. 2E275]MCU4674786.1 23S rRNA pseudouridine(955/2504/2580) synthase RluC [Catenovulum sp. 2E275]